MSEKGKFMETGEMGFCPVCGTTSEVVVLPDDRLQARIAKLVERLVYPFVPEGNTPIMILRESFVQIREILEPPYGRNVREMLVCIQALLVMAAEAQGELTGEEIDLVRTTVETLEAIRG
jgi:hypothetical protein